MTRDNTAVTRLRKPISEQKVMNTVMLRLFIENVDLIG